MKVKLLSRVPLPATPWTAANQAPPSMGFCSGQALIAVAAGAAAVAKLKKLFSTFSVLGGPLTWILNIAVGLICTAAGKVLYGIGYCAAFNKKLTIKGTAAPWDAFVNVSWK